MSKDPKTAKKQPNSPERSPLKGSAFPDRITPASAEDIKRPRSEMTREGDPDLPEFVAAREALARLGG